MYGNSSLKKAVQTHFLGSDHKARLREQLVVCFRPPAAHHTGSYERKDVRLGNRVGSIEIGQSRYKALRRV